MRTWRILPLTLIVLGACGTSSLDETATTSTTTVTVEADIGATTTTVAAPDSTTATIETTTTTAPPAAPTVGALDQLAVAPEADRAGYDRDLFEHWTTQPDGCSTRERVLIDEAVTPAATGSGCAVTTGRWISAYDGVEVLEASDLDIDHMVPLAEAWDSGANTWDPARREAFANDLEAPEALIAVTASSNRSKSDQDPAEWKPPASGYWCTYATAWVTVKVRWELTADQAEHDALASMLATCDGSPPPPPVSTPPPPTVPATTVPPVTSGSVTYANCDAARAAGAAPIYRGEPGYSSKLDRDGDGVACE